MKAKQIVRGDVWRNKDVLAAAKSADIRLFCVAYVTQACSRLFRAGDVLVCDASRKAVSSRETDPRFLLELFQKGVKIYSCEALHAKCAVFGNTVLLGSANLSESSANRLIELSILVKDSDLATSVLAFIQKQTFGSSPLSERDLEKLCDVWRNSKCRPWQIGLCKRKKSRSRRGPINHVVTVTELTGSPRALTQKELDESEARAEQQAKGNVFSTQNNVLDWYYTSEKWSDRQPKEDDSIIDVSYSSNKKNARAKVYGPAKVVMVDYVKGKKVHIVHYLSPKKGISFSEFRRKFNLKKSINRHDLPDDFFDEMVKFIKDELKRRRKG